jgi:hypothetical protein
MRADQIAYRRSHPQDIAAIRLSVDSVLQKKSGTANTIAMQKVNHE